MLDTPVTKLSGVGAKRAENLAELGIFNVEDLLSYYPFRYEDIQARQLAEINDQEKVTLKGVVVSPAVVNRFGYKKSRLQFRMMQDQAVFSVSFFNQPYLKDKVEVAQEIAVYGKWDAKRQALTGMKILGSGQEDSFATIYHVSKAIRQKTLIDLIKQAFTKFGDQIEENLPKSLIDKYRLFSRDQAMYAMHSNKNTDDRLQTRRREVIEDICVFHCNIT